MWLKSFSQETIKANFLKDEYFDFNMEEYPILVLMLILGREFFAELGL
jgi:hypothetical protein